MSGFRVFVIGMVNALLLVVIILTTILGALSGLASHYFIGFFRPNNIPYEAYALFAFVVGGVLYLIASPTPFSVALRKGFSPPSPSAVWVLRPDRNPRAGC